MFKEIQRKIISGVTVLICSVVSFGATDLRLQ
jgi:hypothetical protein